MFADLKLAPSKERVLVELFFDLKVPYVVHDRNNKLRFAYKTTDYYVEVEVPANYADDAELLNDWVQWSFEDHDCCYVENVNVWDKNKKEFRFN